MKKLLLLLFLVSNFAFSQSYYFSKLTKSIYVQTSEGERQRVLGTYNGPYCFKFENVSSSSPSNPKLFTLLEPGESDRPGLDYYTLTYKKGYIDLNGETASLERYYYTGDGQVVTVAITTNFSVAIILKGNEIWEFTK